MSELKEENPNQVSESTAAVAVQGSAEEEANEAAKPKQPTAQDLLKEDLGEVKIRRAKGSKNIQVGHCHIISTYNNTKVIITDEAGNTISWSSSGKCNFRGSRKSTAYAAQVVTQDAARTAMSHGLKELSNVFLKGAGLGRDAAVRALQSLGLIISGIKETTPIPHNGCRAPKPRRV